MLESVAVEGCSHKFKWTGHLNYEGFWTRPILVTDKVDVSAMKPVPVPLQTSEDFHRNGVVSLDGDVPIRMVELKAGRQSVKLLATDGSVRCVNPVLFICNEGCGTHMVSTCNSRDEGVCAPCEKRYRGRVRAIARMPMLVAKKGSALLVTLTAPGRKRHCLTHTYKDKNGKVQPSIKCDWDVYDRNEIPFGAGSGCVECKCSENRIVFHEDLQVFNSTISRKFNDFITDIRRTFPEFEKVQYFRANEPQKRGALHIHCLMIMKRAVKVDTAMSERMTAIAMRLGFGHQLDIKQIGFGDLDQVKAARYVAKYVSKTDAHASVPYYDEAVTFEVDKETGEMVMIRIPRRRPRTWSASRHWGVSMKLIVLHQKEGAYGSKRFSQELLDNSLGWLTDWQSEAELVV